MKWIECLQSYSFVLKHRSRRSNRVVDALSKRKALLTTMTIEMIGLKEMMSTYGEYADARFC